jgi:hypothetical protein
LLLVLQLITVVAIILAAVSGQGDRDSYFGVAIAVMLIGVAFLSNVSTPEQLLALSEAERFGAERLNAIAHPIAWLFFAAATGIGACVFRTPRVVIETEEAHDLHR